MNITWHMTLTLEKSMWTYVTDAATCVPGAGGEEGVAGAVMGVPLGPGPRQRGKLSGQTSCSRGIGREKMSAAR